VKNSFVFYESFYDVLQMLPDAEDWRTLIESVCEYAFTGEHEPLPTPALEIAFKHFQISIDGASARYEKAVENGKKGGRPSKNVFIPPDVWIGAIEEHGSVPKAAKALGLAKQTLYNWILASDDPRLEKVQKSKNLSVSVSVSDSVSESESDKRNFKKAPTQSSAGLYGPPTVPDEKRYDRYEFPPMPELHLDGK
jgi:hypothetical protein